MSLLDELERLIAEARALLGDPPRYVPLSDEEQRELFGE